MLDLPFRGFSEGARSFPPKPGELEGADHPLCSACLDKNVVAVLSHNLLPEVFIRNARSQQNTGICGDCSEARQNQSPVLFREVAVVYHDGDRLCSQNNGSFIKGWRVTNFPCAHRCCAPEFCEKHQVVCNDQKGGASWIISWSLLQLRAWRCTSLACVFRATG
jgi:hypothetical protein